MTTLELASRETRYLRTVKVLSELTRQCQLRAEGLSVTEVASVIGISRRTAMYREGLLKSIERKGCGGRRAT